MKRHDPKPAPSPSPPSLAFDRQTLRTLDQAALGDVAGGTGLPCATAIITITIVLKKKMEETLI